MKNKCFVRPIKRYDTQELCNSLLNISLGDDQICSAVCGETLQCEEITISILHFLWVYLIFRGFKQRADHFKRIVYPFHSKTFYYLAIFEIIIILTSVCCYIFFCLFPSLYSFYRYQISNPLNWSLPLKNRCNLFIKY